MGIVVAGSHNLHLARIFRFARAVDHFHQGKAKRTNYKSENLQKVELVRQVKERVVIPVATSHL